MTFSFDKHFSFKFNLLLTTSALPQKWILEDGKIVHELISMKNLTHWYYIISIIQLWTNHKMNNFRKKKKAGEKTFHSLHRKIPLPLGSSLGTLVKFFKLHPLHHPLVPWYTHFFGLIYSKLKIFLIHHVHYNQFIRGKGLLKFWRYFENILWIFKVLKFHIK